MNQHQIALVANEREQCGLTAGLRFHGSERLGSFPDNGGFFTRNQSSPCGPAQAHHLMQYAVTFSGEWNGRDFSGNLRPGLVSGGHAVLFTKRASSSKTIVRGAAAGRKFTT